jgi:twinkle protein
MNHIFSNTDTDFAEYYDEAEPIAKVIPADAWADELVKLHTQPLRLTGARLPWKATHEHIRFRPGEVTIWTGYSGHGKSLVLGNASLGFTAQEEKTCIASFEMLPIATLERMERQAAMTLQPADEFTPRFMSWLRDKVWLYNHVGQADLRMLYAVIRYAGRKLGVQHFIIDSLMRCVRGEDDYNGQKDFVTMLSTLAKDLAMHIHLVHHVRKAEDETKPPGKQDIKGSGAIADNVDQILVVWRNKVKERAIEKLATQGELIPDDVRDKPDAVLDCVKNRASGDERRFPLWFHRDSLQFTGDPRCKPLNFMGSLV